MINETLVKETLDNLLLIYEKDVKLFSKSYKSLPFSLYEEIERLSISKSTLYIDLCKKARSVANKFHKNV